MKLNTHPDASAVDADSVCFTVEDDKSSRCIKITCEATENSVLALEDELDGLINALIAMRDVIIPKTWNEGE